MDPGQLGAALAATISPDERPRKQGEQFLKRAATQDGFLVATLHVVASEQFDVAVRQAAAVHFKNHIKTYWSPRDSDSADHVVAEPEKGQVRQHLLQIMLKSPGVVQAQLAEALTLISQTDFPKRWPDLLPQLVAQLRDHADDYNALYGALTSANSISKRFRQGEVLAGDLNEELRLCQEAFGGPLLDIARGVTAQVQGNPGASRESLTNPLRCARLAFRIWYSLNYFGLSEMEFEMLGEFMQIFTFYLALEVPAFVEEDPEREGLLDSVKSAVCSNINLLMLKEEDDWADQHLPGALTAVWELLMKVTPRPGQDSLAMEAIRFLVTVARSGHHQLFAQGSILQQIVERIVIPNLRLRDEDEERFEGNFIEYVRRDAEGSDSDTRRRLACELVKALTEQFERQVTDLCAGYVGAMLGEYYADPLAAWKAKDCATYLVSALAVKGTTQAMGATKTNELINVVDFFSQHIVKDLEGPCPSAILTADALRYATTFRSQLPKEVLMAAMPKVIACLRSDANVVHSYAATLVDRLLAIKEAGRPRFTPEDMSPHIQPLLENLFGALDKDESEENEYIMRCIMRVVSFLGPNVAPVAAAFVQMLSKVVLTVCRNPRNPAFSHFLFEALAGVIRHSLPAQPSLAEPIEATLFPPINHILQQDVQEYLPYAFQVVALLLELRPSPAPAAYMQLLPPLLTPQIWENQGNIPALVRLLSAYLIRASWEVVQGGHLLPILGVFQKLNATKAFDHGGFAILEALVEHLALKDYDAHLGTILSLVFTRLQMSRTKKYLRCFVVFFGKLVVKVGAQVVLDKVDGVQPGLAMSIVQGVFGPHLPAVHGSDEEKVALVAAARVLTQTRQMQQFPQAAGAWASVAKGAMEMLEREEEGFRLKSQEEELDDLLQGYSAQYAQLANAVRPSEEPVSDVANAGEYFAQELARWKQAHPGHLESALSQGLSPQQWATLQAWMAAPHSVGK